MRQALAAAGVAGRSGAEIDHVELFGPSPRSDADSRNFVLCPGNAYDRSPCGTGTSAKLACLHADGKLRPGEVWRQESITGSVFDGRFTIDADHAGRASCPRSRAPPTSRARRRSSSTSAIRSPGASGQSR